MAKQVVSMSVGVVDDFLIANHKHVMVGLCANQQRLLPNFILTNELY